MTVHLPGLKSGDVIQGYRVLRLLGEGGFGAVYELVHSQFGGRAALKVLALGPENREQKQRFLNEARAANAVRHPGIVRIFGTGELSSGAPWLLMEFLEGETLEQRIEAVHTGQAPISHDPLALIYQLADVLRVLHERGIVHRDLKPANIKLTPDPTRPEGELPKLLDFGIAKFISHSLLEPRDLGPKQPHTQAHTMMGTPGYMAPEQCVSAGTVNGAADVYALGVLVYELFSGKRPFEAVMPEIVTLKLTQEAPKLVAPGVPEELAELVRGMLQRRPEHRPTMAQVAEVLAKLGGRGISGVQLRAIHGPAKAKEDGVRPEKVWGIAALLGGLSGLLVFLALRAWQGPAERVVVVQTMRSVQAEDLGQPGERAEDPPVVPMRDAMDPGEDMLPDLTQATPDMRSGKPEPTHPKPACTPRLVDDKCVSGVGLDAKHQHVLVEAARQAEIKLCGEQKIVLVPALQGFLACDSRPPNVSKEQCERFLTLADAKVDAAWAPPTRVEMRCATK